MSAPRCTSRSTTTDPPASSDPGEPRQAGPGRARHHRHAGAGHCRGRRLPGGAPPGRRLPCQRDAAPRGHACGLPGRIPCAADPGMTIRVLLADDQPLLRAGLKVLIDEAPDLEVVGEATTGFEAVELAKSARADVVLMDIRMPQLDGLAATRMITADDDLAGVRVLILTTFEIDEYVFQALRAGASGFLGKSAGPEELIGAIRIVDRGDALLTPAATKSLIARF